MRLLGRACHSRRSREVFGRFRIKPLTSVRFGSACSIHCQRGSVASRFPAMALVRSRQRISTFSCSTGHILLTSVWRRSGMCWYEWRHRFLSLLTEPVAGQKISRALAPSKRLVLRTGCAICRLRTSTSSAIRQVCSEMSCCKTMCSIVPFSNLGNAVGRDCRLCRATARVVPAHANLRRSRGYPGLGEQLRSCHCRVGPHSHSSAV